MTAREQAEELIDRYICIPVVYHCKNGCITIDAMDMDAIKRCTLIAVDLVIENIEDDYLGKELEYWNEVKNEIERL